MGKTISALGQMESIYPVKKIPSANARGMEKRGITPFRKKNDMGIGIQKKFAENRSREEDRYAKEIQTEIISVAMAAASKIVGREVSNEDNERLVKEFLEENN